MPKETTVYRVGSLTYTRRQLISLFAWLLWGDFCYMLMETVVPSILPLKFKALGASNLSIGLILTTSPMVINSVLNPIISFRSDRYRSRWGRRLPFILFTLPFLVVLLLAVGFADEMGFGLHRWISGAAAGGGNPVTDWLAARTSSLSANQCAVLMIGITMVLFSVVNTFVSSVFWYLFNDVVPENLLARFMSWFRLVSTMAASFYNFFVFRYAESHAAEIFVGAAVLYFVGFGLMCLKVKEGEYAPPPPLERGRSGLLAAIRTFGKECHTLPHYWYVFLIGMCMAGTWATGPFSLLFLLATGLDVAKIGTINGTANIAGSLMILLSGWLADRYHPIRIVAIGFVMQIVLVLPAQLIWLFHTPTPDATYYLWMAISVGLAAPAAAFFGVLDPPMFMRIFPRERYGQFCAANAMWRSASLIVNGLLAGLFFDLLASRVGKERAYFYLPLWQLFFIVLALYFLFRLYRSWQAYGGDEHYVAIVPDLATTAEGRS